VKIRFLRACGGNAVDSVHDLDPTAAALLVKAGMAAFVKDPVQAAQPTPPSTESASEIPPLVDAPTAAPPLSDDDAAIGFHITSSPAKITGTASVGKARRKRGG
jgi:hypothetical protein